MSYWYLQPLGESYLLVGILVFALVALLVIRPQFQGLTTKRHWILTGLRFAVIMLIALTLLRPTWVRTIKETQSSLLVLMFDSSRSMSVPDAADGISRWDAQKQTLQRLAPELASLGDDVDVALYQFDENAQRLETVDGQVQLPSNPEGRFTDIGSSIAEVMQQNLGKKLAGVILLSDGAQRVYTPKVEMQQAARDLARLETPLHTVTYGKAIDPSQARDVAVETLADHYTVFVKNEVAIKSSIHIQGMANLPVPVQLIIEDSQGQKTIVETQEVTTPKVEETVDVTFRYTPQASGQFKVSVLVPDQEGELVTKNNVLSAYLNVLEGGLKILYLEGRTVDRPEQKWLRQVVAESADMELDFRWIDRRRRDLWPVNLTDEIKNGKYDVFIIGDVDSSALSPETLDLLAAQVEDGKGLIMLGGFHSFGAGGYQTTVMQNVLPVEMSRFDRQDFDAPIRTDMHIAGPITIVASENHFLSSLGTDEEGTPAFTAVPSLSGANKIVGPKRRGVTILESQSGQPLLVAGEYGLGRTLAFTADSTWRWVMAGKGSIHKRFWRQVVLWLARKDGLESRDVWVQLGQRRYVPGAPITFTAGANTQSGDPVQGATFETHLIAPDGTRSPIRTLPGDSVIEGSLNAGESMGDYTIEVVAKQNGTTLGTGLGRFFVYDQDLELSDPSARPSQLAALSAITKDVGGRTWTPEELPQLIEQIKNRPPETEVEVQTKWTWPESGRDSWINLMLIVGLLGWEWYLRKRWSMV
ncbi:glutamine amidotransferase [Bremerella sp. T1]|uniref:glutamine amidotransferase n=1 Tax=Bremerella sp. TYQ1 TaxID=3119568 RepID=UPI001CCCEB56|nr:glutamine amidotransferase [Bremerella volcania]UBM34156.1 glutamine amidotransferase [Bremerella volcania]